MERTAPILEKVESGFNSTYRFGLHESDVRNRVESNAFHKHLEIHHPEHQGDMSVFKCKVLGTYKRSLDRQVAEGVQLERSEAVTDALIQLAMTLLAEDSGVIWVGTLQKTVFCLFQVTFGLIWSPKCPNQTGSILF